MPGHQSKSLLEMPFGDLQKKWVHRHPVEELREFLIHHGQLSSGKKPELVDRVVDFAEEKAKDVIEEALADDDDAAAPLPKEIKEDDVVKRIASISEAERDLLVGRHLRSLGGEFATQYGELLRAAIRSDPPEMRGRLLIQLTKTGMSPRGPTLGHGVTSISGTVTVAHAHSVTTAHGMFQRTTCQMITRVSRSLHMVI